MIQRTASNAKSAKSLLTQAKPEVVADQYVSQQYVDGVLTLRHWMGEFYRYHRGRYEDMTRSDVKNDLVAFLHARYSNIRNTEVSNILVNVAARCAVLSLRQIPAWLDGGHEIAGAWDPNCTLATQSALVNLDWLGDAKKRQRSAVPATPQYFSLNATDYEFKADASKPARWLEFLGELWPDDPLSIRLLQQWFGYCLTADTSHQKIMLMVGPKRSGKGTIARVIRSIVGDRNCCAPTLAGLATNFGLSPLVGKSVAIIGDARLSGRTDVAATTERLLSISGEDAQTIDRKHRESITVQLTTRFTIVSNELPQLNDASGALAGRLLILRLTNSFYGNEDRQLSRHLHAERQGILLWAIEGWRDLRDTGHFVQSRSGRELTDQMEDLSSPITAFVRDRCTTDLDQDGSPPQVSLDGLYREYRDWCEHVGINRTPTAASFSRDLIAAFPHIRRARPRKTDGRQTWFQGIRRLSSSSSY